METIGKVMQAVAVVGLAVVGVLVVCNWTATRLIPVLF